MADSARSRGVRKSFEHPDCVRRFPRGLGAFVEIGALGVARAVLDDRATTVKPAQQEILWTTVEVRPE